jgi:putative addiction module killer protein
LEGGVHKIIVTHRTKDGREPFTDWLVALPDKTLRHRVLVRLRRIEQGNYGDFKRFSGILEIRLNFGKGYRIYCGELDDVMVILLVGGDKSSQGNDINLALEYWREYHEQTKNENI